MNIILGDKPKWTGDPSCKVCFGYGVTPEIGGTWNVCFVCQQHLYYPFTRQRPLKSIGEVEDELDRFEDFWKALGVGPQWGLNGHRTREDACRRLLEDNNLTSIMDNEKSTEIKWHNPDNVPADKIPAGWRLLVPEEVGNMPVNSCCIWLQGLRQFYMTEDACGFSDKFTYIISDTYPLPEKYRVVVEPSPLDRQEGGEHYKSCKVQPITFIHANNLNFLEGSVIKRVCRHRRKNGAEDLRKAIHELELMLELEYNEKP